VLKLLELCLLVHCLGIVSRLLSYTRRLGIVRSLLSHALCLGIAKMLDYFDYLRLIDLLYHLVIVDHFELGFVFVVCFVQIVICYLGCLFDSGFVGHFLGFVHFVIGLLGCLFGCLGCLFAGLLEVHCSRSLLRFFAFCNWPFRMCI
jgi:hypothetical protein